MDDKKMLAQFTREMMGPSVAHMTDEELDAWMEPWRVVVDAADTSPGFPQWFINRRDEARSKLLTLLALRRDHSGTCMLCGGVFWLNEMTNRVGSYTCLDCYERVMAELLGP